MARDLEINIVVNDQEAKGKVEAYDAALDKTTASAKAAGQAQTDLEVRTQKAAAAIGVEASELNKIRAQLAAGIDPKFIKTLDQDIPAASAKAAAGFRNTNQAAQQATSGFGNLDRMAERIVARMAILYALRGTFQFVESLFTDAQKLEQVAAELGLTTDKVQQLQFVATSTYLPMNLFGTAIGELTKKVVTENGGASKALRDLGLDLDRLKTLDAGQRFDAVARAIAGVQDNAKRLGLEIEVFGTDKLDPAIKKLAELEKQADKVSHALSKDQVDALAAVAKGWELAATASKNYFAGILANVVLAQGQQTTGTRIGGTLAAILPLLPPQIQQLITGTYSEPGLSNAALDQQMRTRRVGAPGWVDVMGLPPVTPPGAFGKELDKADLAAIAAFEKAITAETEHQITLKTQEAALTKEMWTASLHTAKLISQEFEKQIGLLAKEMDLAIQAEFEARRANAAALGFDVAGNRLGTPEAIGSPEDVYQKTINALAAQRARMPGLVTTEQENQAYRVLRAAQSGGARDLYGNPIIAGADAYGNVPGFASGGIVSVGEFGPEKVALPYGSAVFPNNMADSGAGWAGRPFGMPGSWQAFFEAASKGSWFTQPSPGMMGGGGFTVGDIHIHGNVSNELDVRRMADNVARRIKSQLDRQTNTTR